MALSRGALKPQIVQDLAHFEVLKSAPEVGDSSDHVVFDRAFFNVHAFGDVGVRQVFVEAEADGQLATFRQLFETIFNEVLESFVIPFLR